MFRYALFALLPTAAYPCIQQEEFLPTDLALAPVVVVATVTGYSQNHDTQISAMHLQVNDVMKGQAPAELSLEWGPLLTSLPPETWNRGTDLIVAAFPIADGQRWQLALEPCGSAWMLTDTPQNRQIVADAIREGE
jgi:hypothetical protein